MQFPSRIQPTPKPSRHAAGSRRVLLPALILLLAGLLDAPAFAQTCAPGPKRYTNAQLDTAQARSALAGIRSGAAGADARADLLIRILVDAARAEALDDAERARQLHDFARERLSREGWRATQRGERAEVAFALGEMRRLGLTNVPQDAASACRAYALAAKRGSVDGRYREALCATQQDREQALALMEQAAAEGHPRAMEALGTLCLQSAPPRLECAADWFCQAADQGLARAALLAGWLLSEEDSPVRDLSRAIALYEQAAATGDAAAQNNLAEIHERGWQGTVNLPRALELYEASSRQGLPQAQLNLARLLFKTSEPGSDRRREALRWLAEARPKLPKEAQAVEAEFGLVGR